MLWSEPRRTAAQRTAPQQTTLQQIAAQPSLLSLHIKPELVPCCSRSAGCQGHLLGARQAWCGGSCLHRPIQPNSALGDDGPPVTSTHTHMELQGPRAPRVGSHCVVSVSIKFLQHCMHACMTMMVVVLCSHARPQQAPQASSGVTRCPVCGTA
jgi:hypothetical protein